MKLEKDHYTISRETLQKVMDALQSNFFGTCDAGDGYVDEYNNDEVIEAHSKLEAEISQQNVKHMRPQ